MLPAHDADFFARNRYAILRQAVPEDRISAAHARLEADTRSMLQRLAELGIDRDAPDLGDQVRRRLAALPAEARADAMVLTGHLSHETRLSPEIRALCTDPGLVGRLEAACGHPLAYVHMPPMARFILPGNDQAGVPVHQDWSYNEHMSDFLVVWVPLVPIDSDCGGVTVYPGLHRDEPVPVEDLNGVWLQGLSVDPAAGVACAPMAPGDVLIFDKYLVHASMPNRSGRIRYSLDLRYFSPRDQSTKHHMDIRTGEVHEPRESP